MFVFLRTFSGPFSGRLALIFLAVFALGAGLFVSEATLSATGQPTLTFFVAKPAKITAGQAVKLQWQASNATRVAIDHGVGEVNRKTEVTVRPRVTTRYVISASNANGSAKRSLTVTVNAAPTPTPPSPAICPVPIAAVDTSTVAARVGNGTPGSCTESALRTEVAKGGTITFNCGTDPTTIRISQTIEVPADRDTVIDGGGKVTLDGNRAVRILNMTQQSYRTNRRGLTLQRLKLVRGKAPASGYVAKDPTKPKCAYGYAQGRFKCATRGST
jgi:hypothetical protein